MSIQEIEEVPPSPSNIKNESVREEDKEITLLQDGPDLYKLIAHTGTAPNGSPVFEATFIPQDTSVFDHASPNDVFVALQMAHDSFQPHLFNNLVIDAMRNKRCRHTNILSIKHMFDSDGRACVVMPLNEVQSLRYIIASTPIFRQGFPEDCIAVALRETIYGLGCVHKYSAHKKLTVGDIFFHLDDRCIKLAYGGSSFDRKLEMEATFASTSGQLPIWSVHQWGAAPEVYDSAHDSKTYICKSDIWLLGISALELAYGGLEFGKREDLLRFISWIRTEKRLPNKGEEIDYSLVQNEAVKIDGQEERKNKRIHNKVEKTLKQTMRNMKVRYMIAKIQKKHYKIKEYNEEKDKKNKWKKAKKFLRGKADAIPIPEKIKSKEKKINCFTKEFGKMVALCLAEDPDMRPDCWDLVHHKFFNKSRTVTYFDEVVVKRAKDPIWYF
ncbi:Protein kinase domain-containing protein [Heracleum sosnowskyi]|uniref:Protein kinase domain-containing protein n=1 Tax=Heracleum sosnowskyi TaxID=360622 RepID=A0AAD8J4X3_9APIA|nr:Protein kinase domain-containing protein [Heracleum sosnowskyi]